MPGFSINNGATATGGGPSHTTEPRRMHRWVWEVMGPEAGFTPMGDTWASQSRTLKLLLKSCSRPSYSFETPEMHHNQEKAYFAGKHTWESINLTWYDAEQPVDVSRAIWEWNQGVLNMEQQTVAPPSFYKRQSKLTMRNGLGAANESWDILGSWPSQSNWQALDYTNHELQVVEVRLHFDRAVRDQSVNVPNLTLANPGASVNLV